MMNLFLQLKVKAALGRDFRIHQDKSGYIFFKDRKQRAHYSLYSVGMHDDQILDIAKMIEEVYKENKRDNRGPRREIPIRNLNSNTELSRKYVTRVLNLNNSSLHKFFLLTSGAYISSPGTDDLLITLAEAKFESIGAFHRVYVNNNVFETLQETYVLPGVDEDIAYNAARQMLNAAMMRHSVEKIARILTFVANDDPKLTLEQHLRLKDDSAFATIQSLKRFDQFSFIEEFIARKREYSELGHKLAAPDLYALRFLMSRDYKNIPQDFLYNRVTSMEPIIRGDVRLRLLISYLSKTELRRFSSYEIKSITDLTIEGEPSLWSKTPLIFAALAEVLVQKGHKRTLDVIHELAKKGDSERDSQKQTEAKVLLILEALKPENDEMPFSWAAQMSEYGWVLNSDSNSVELAFEVL